MTVSVSRKAKQKVSGLFLLIFAFTAGDLRAAGPVFFDNDESVSIYRDFDDGLFGRSLYRGVVFSVKLDSFDRYRSLPVSGIDSLSAYLLSDDTARSLVRGDVPGIILKEKVSGVLNESGEEPGSWLFGYSRDGIEIEFRLERAPGDLLEEVDRTYPAKPVIAEQVKDSYRDGWVIRILVAENVYRPAVAIIDYEDVLISAALLGETFQPLWGIHDGNGLLEGPER